MRISFFGGGTDYPAWFREHRGAVLATTIDKYCYLHCRYLPPFFDYRSRIVWSQIECVHDHADVTHPAIRGILQWLNLEAGLEIHHHGDLPARTGLGSSSSFSVGLLHALQALRGDAVSRRVLAEQAIHVEQEVLRENVGVQDQIQAAFGGFNRIDIAENGSFDVVPLRLPASRFAELQDHLLLIYTGLSRHASEIAGEQIASIGRKTAELRAMQAMVPEGERILGSRGSLLDFGRLLHDGWQLKRSLSSKVAPSFVNDIYEAARGAGAEGGKLLGAGGGGFMLIFVEPERRAAVLRALEKLLPVPFCFEATGTQLLRYDAREIGAAESAAEA